MMPLNAQAQEFDRFSERDDPAIRVFDYLPGKAHVEELREFTRRTGMPDMWRWHLHTKPARGSRFHIVAENITVPESLRSKVGTAPCPQCSLHAGKYFEGMLAWFPDDKALRVIGHECAKQVAGEQALTVARTEFRRRQADSAATSFLIDNLPKVASAETVLLELYLRARQLDRTARSIRNALVGKTRAGLKVEIAGQLPLYEVVQVALIDRAGRPMLDKDGNIAHTEQHRTVATVEVVGLELFRAPQTCEAIAARAAAALTGLATETEDQALDLLDRLGENGRIDAAKRINEAWKLISDCRHLFSRMQGFLAADNIERFGLWGQDRRAPARLHAAAFANGRVEIGEVGRKAVTIWPHADVWNPVPAAPPPLS